MSDPETAHEKVRVGCKSSTKARPVQYGQASREYHGQKQNQQGKCYNHSELGCLGPDKNHMLGKDEWPESFLGNHGSVAFNRLKYFTGLKRAFIGKLPKTREF